MVHACMGVGVGVGVGVCFLGFGFLKRDKGVSWVGREVGRV